MSFADLVPADIQARIAAGELVETEPLPEPEPVAAPVVVEGVPLCRFCEEPIVSTANAYRRILGWERRRRGGGTNQITLREPTGEWACSSCIDDAKRGRRGQEALL